MAKNPKDDAPLPTRAVRPRDSGGEARQRILEKYLAQFDKEYSVWRVPNSPGGNASERLSSEQLHERVLALENEPAEEFPEVMEAISTPNSATPSSDPMGYEPMAPSTVVVTPSAAAAARFASASTPPSAHPAETSTSSSVAAVVAPSAPSTSVSLSASSVGAPLPVESSTSSNSTPPSGSDPLVGSSSSSGGSLSGMDDESMRVGSSVVGSYSVACTLRHHLDAVRSLAWHSSEPALVTGGDDGVVKLWNLRPGAMKSGYEYRPVVNLRGHEGAVFSCVFDAEGEHLLSAGLDGRIRVWQLPDMDGDPYTERDHAISFLAASLEGHSDAVWDLCRHPTNAVVASCGADGWVRLWDYEEATALSTLRYPFAATVVPGGGVVDPMPVSARFLPANATQLAVAFSTQAVVVYDTEQEQAVQTMLDEGADPPSGQLNALACGPSLLYTVDDGGQLKAWDVRMDQPVHATAVHTGAATSVDVDPDGLAVVTASIQGSLRLWDTRMYKCVQDITAHRRKWDEGALCVRFHPHLSALASSGADAIVNIFDKSYPKVQK